VRSTLSRWWVVERIGSAGRARPGRYVVEVCQICEGVVKYRRDARLCFWWIGKLIHEAWAAVTLLRSFNDIYRLVPFLPSLQLAHREIQSDQLLYSWS
jgi:hypothetical protein